MTAGSGGDIAIGSLSIANCSEYICWLWSSCAKAMHVILVVWYLLLVVRLVWLILGLLLGRLE